MWSGFPISFLELCCGVMLACLSNQVYLVVEAEICLTWGFFWWFDSLDSLIFELTVFIAIRGNYDFRIKLQASILVLRWHKEAGQAKKRWKKKSPGPRSPKIVFEWSENNSIRALSSYFLMQNFKCPVRTVCIYMVHYMTYEVIYMMSLIIVP